MNAIADFDDLDSPQPNAFWDDLGALLFSFDGRIDQAQALVGLAAATVVNGVTLFGGLAVLLAMEATTGTGWLDGLAFLLIFTVTIGSGWMSLALQVKRWHDAGKSGWFVLLGCIPYIGPLIVLAAYVGLPSDPMPNAHGPRPRGPLRPATPRDLMDDDYDFLSGGQPAGVEAEWC
jgi:uncharacterized membrane protein YhaH (DUF805 family)